MHTKGGVALASQSAGNEPAAEKGTKCQHLECCTLEGGDMADREPLSLSDKSYRGGIPSIYGLKAVCAIFVVAIHCGNWGKENIMPILTVAVPCFYMVSGYFLYAGSPEKEIQRAWKWFKKIIRITVLVNLFYYLLNTALGISYSGKELWINLVTGAQISSPLWYLTSFWEALLVFILIRKTCPKLLAAMPLCLIVHLLTTRYSFIFFDEMPKGPIRMGTNFVTIALPFLCLGYLLARYKEKLLTLPAIFLWPFVFSILALVEYSFFWDTNVRMATYLIMTPFLATSLLLVCLKYPDFSTPFLVWMGKEHSANIYYFHLAVSDILVRAAWNMGFILNPWSAYPTLVATCALSMILCWLQRRIKWK